MLLPILSLPFPQNRIILTFGKVLPKPTFYYARVQLGTLPMVATYSFRVTNGYKFTFPCVN